MRSAPSRTAASNTWREPSTLIVRVASLAWRTVKARCTTTSAPRTASRTLARSWTSPCRYSVLRQPRVFGSNGRRAMPTMRFTRRERSSAETRAIPRSPVGPVTATVRPCCAGTTVLYRLRAACLLDDLHVLAVLQDVDRVRAHRVVAGAAVHDVADMVRHVDRVLPRAHRDVVLAGASCDAVVPVPELHLVVAAARVDRETPADAGDVVVAGAADQRARAGVGEDLIVAGPAVGVVVACPRVDPVPTRPAEQAVVARLPQEDVVAVLPQNLVVAGPGVGHVVSGAEQHGVVPGAGDRKVVARPAVELVRPGPAL